MNAMIITERYSIRETKNSTDVREVTKIHRITGDYQLEDYGSDAYIVLKCFNCHGLNTILIGDVEVFTESGVLIHRISTDKHTQVKTIYARNGHGRGMFELRSNDTTICREVNDLGQLTEYLLTSSYLNTIVTLENGKRYTLRDCELKGLGLNTSSDTPSLIKDGNNTYIFSDSEVISLTGRFQQLFD